MEREILEAILGSFSKIVEDLSEIKEILNNKNKIYAKIPENIKNSMSDNINYHLINGDKGLKIQHFNQVEECDNNQKQNFENNLNTCLKRNINLDNEEKLSYHKLVQNDAPIK